MVTNVEICRSDSGSRPQLVAFSLAVLLSVIPTHLSASEIVINDCNGITRAQQEIAKESDQYDVTISLQGNTPAPAKVLLVSDETSIEQDVVNGKISFTGLTSGTYEFCDAEKMAKISQAHFSQTADTQIASTGGLAIGAAALSGVALALGSGGDSSGDATTAQQNNLIGSIPTQNNAPSVRPSTPATSRPSSQSDRDCLNGAKIQPLSPFE